MDIDKIILELTLEEKCRLLVGQDAWHTYAIPRLNIPSIMMADGPHGLRKQLDSGNMMTMNEAYKAVCFPPAVTVASSFDPKIAYKMGSAIADECLYKDVHVLLGPGINIKRSPLCGRNFEYYSEDPYLSGEMGAAFVRGLQDKKVGACVKHFALNSQETYRMISNSVVDKRAFYEIYTKAFRRVLLEQPDMLMCSYNKVDGIYASENKSLLNDVARDEFGFQNVIVSDWTAVNDRSDALKASLDLEMPGHDYAWKKLMKDYHKGLITKEQIDASVKRILALVDRKKDQKIIPFDLAKNHEIAYEIAKESMVLLKNENDTLPLKTTERIAIIGQLAKTVRYQGGGSSHINPYKVESMLENIPPLVKYTYADGYRLEGDGYDLEYIEEAKKAVLHKDKVVLVIGLTDVYESEGYDRTHLDLPKGHTELLKAIYELNKNIVVVLQIGSPVVMPWLSQVKAVLNAYLVGEAGAKAVMHMLYGTAYPSGRLAETFPLSLESTPCHAHFAKGNGDVLYQESIYVGYRYYESKPEPVLFPFGYGLSYTSFIYGNLKVSDEIITTPTKIDISVDVKNTGFWVGKEVVQLYVEAPQTGVFKPLRELKRFDKVVIEPGKTVTVSMSLSTDDLGYYDPTYQKVVTENGQYKLQIMKNANELLLETTLSVEFEQIVESNQAIINAKSYYLSEGLSMGYSDFETLLGKVAASEIVVPKRPFTLNNTLADINKTFLGGIIYRSAKKEAAKATIDFSAENLLMVEKSLGETPLRSVVIMSGGILKMHTMKGLLSLINHHPIQAIKHFFERE